MMENRWAGDRPRPAGATSATIAVAYAAQIVLSPMVMEQKERANEKQIDMRKAPFFGLNVKVNPRE